MNEDPKFLFGAFAALLVLIGLGGLLCMGPAGVKTSISSWYASGYGSDWLIIQYAQSGCRITQWDLDNEAIQNESSSDGIYFVTEKGSVVHLSGHYTFVQDPDSATRKQLTHAPLCFPE